MLGGWQSCDPHAYATLVAPRLTALSLAQATRRGGKKKETTEGAPAAVFGHNRWVSSG